MYLKLVWFSFNSITYKHNISAFRTVLSNEIEKYYHCKSINFYLDLSDFNWYDQAKI